MTIFASERGGGDIVPRIGDVVAKLKAADVSDFANYISDTGILQERLGRFAAAKAYRFFVGTWRLFVPSEPFLMAKAMVAEEILEHRLWRRFSEK